MVTHSCEAQAFGKPVAMSGGSRGEETPELPAFTVEYAQPDCDASEGCNGIKHIVVIGLFRLLRRTLQRVDGALILFSRFVDGAHN